MPKWSSIVLYAISHFLNIYNLAWIMNYLQILTTRLIKNHLNFFSYSWYMKYVWFHMIYRAPANEQPVPTHIYIILTTCNDTERTPLDRCQSLQTLAYILPHVEAPSNCQVCIVIKHVKREIPVNMEGMWLV